MKKYQKLIKDNIDLISEIESSLLHDIDDEDNDIDFSSNHLCIIYVSSGALAMIDENYNFDQISERIASVFANMLFTYASCAYVGKMSHEHQMRCFDLSREIKDNVHYHRMREPMFQNA